MPTNQFTEQHVAELRSLVAGLRAFVAQPFELPEMNVVLDLASRRHDEARQFKYLHEMNSLHAESFVHANRVKLTALLDGYLTVVDSKNPFGIFLFARTVLELNAFLYDFGQRLAGIACKPEANWKSKGEEFFATIIRARFATTHPRKRASLEKAGISLRLLDPINVKTSLEKLEADQEFGDLAKEYAELCDSVHHNLSSQSAANQGYRIDDVARSSGCGGILLREQTAVTRYGYPLDAKAALAVGETIDGVRRCTLACIKWINRLPCTPFSVELITRMTGNPLGFTSTSAPLTRGPSAT